MSKRVNVMKLFFATLLLLMLLINQCDAESNDEEIKNTSTASTPTSGNNNITKRERSAKISSDSVKGKCLHTCMENKKKAITIILHNVYARFFI